MARWANTFYEDYADLDSVYPSRVPFRVYSTESFLDVNPQSKITGKEEKVLYQTWKTKTLPPKFLENWNKWQEWCDQNGYQHILLDDEDLRSLIKNDHKNYLRFYDNLTENIERVDFARLAMMARGGIYADLDTYPTKNKGLMELIHSGKIILGCEPTEHSKSLYSGIMVLCNAFMVSPTGEKPFWKKVMRFVKENYEPYYKPVENTGPMMLTRFYEAHPESFGNVSIRRSCELFPLVANGKYSSECDPSEALVVHEWSNSWSWSFKGFKDPILKNYRYRMFLASLGLGIFILFLASRKK